MKKFYVVLVLLMTLAAVSGCGKEKTDTKVDETKVTGTEASDPKDKGEGTGTGGQDVIDNGKDETDQKDETDKKEEVKKEYHVTRTIQSQAIATNIVGEESEKEVYIYLPPSYYDSEKNYPVIYFLHGYGEDANIFIKNRKLNLDAAFNGGAEEFIVVGVNGRNKLGGSFYANSPVSGNWEDYVVDEVVGYVDDNFRTIKDKASRGICGFSMGGYGAYNIALKHPDVFCALLTMSPGLLTDDDLPAAMTSWIPDPMFKLSYAQTFSPNLESEDHGNIPEMSGTPEDDKIVADWYNGFGNINQKLDAYEALDNPLKAIKIVYGEKDSYVWIPRGCDFLSACLKERKIEHTLDIFPEGHSLPPQVAEDYLVPFFNENLVYEK